MTGNLPIDYFNLFFTKDVKKLIHEQTTKYAEQHISNSRTYLQEHKYARGNHWIKNPMVFKEIDALLAILILMGLVNFPTIR